MSKVWWLKYTQACLKRGLNSTHSFATATPSVASFLGLGRNKTDSLSLQRCGKSVCTCSISMAETIFRLLDFDGLKLTLRTSTPVCAEGQPWCPSAWVKTGVTVLAPVSWLARWRTVGNVRLLSALSSFGIISILCLLVITLFPHLVRCQGTNWNHKPGMLLKFLHLVVSSDVVLIFLYSGDKASYSRGIAVAVCGSWATHHAPCCRWSLKFLPPNSCGQTPPAGPCSCPEALEDSNSPGALCWNLWLPL